jgi:hypothetical protein
MFTDKINLHWATLFVVNIKQEDEQNITITIHNFPKNVQPNKKH